MSSRAERMTGDTRSIRRVWRISSGDVAPFSVPCSSFPNGNTSNEPTVSSGTCVHHFPVINTLAARNEGGDIPGASGKSVSPLADELLHPFLEIRTVSTCVPIDGTASESPKFREGLGFTNTWHPRRSVDVVTVVTRASSLGREGTDGVVIKEALGMCEGRLVTAGDVAVARTGSGVIVAEHFSAKTEVVRVIVEQPHKLPPEFHFVRGSGTEQFSVWRSLGNRDVRVRVLVGTLPGTVDEEFLRSGYTDAFPRATASSKHGEQEVVSPMITCVAELSIGPGGCAEVPTLSRTATNSEAVSEKVVVLVLPPAESAALSPSNWVGRVFDGDKDEIGTAIRPNDLIVFDNNVKESSTPDAGNTPKTMQPFLKFSAASSSGNNELRLLLCCAVGGNLARGSSAAVARFGTLHFHTDEELRVAMNDYARGTFAVESPLLKRKA